MNTKLSLDIWAQTVRQTSVEEEKKNIRQQNK